MHTSVALERKDFDDFNVQEGLHIGIIVKDFRAIVAHAETIRVNLTARYSRGNRPMLISYENNGILSEFTLMTRGTSTNIPGGSASIAPTPARDLSLRPESQSARKQKSPSTAMAAEPTEMLPPTAKMAFRETS